MPTQAPPPVNGEQPPGVSRFQEFLRIPSVSGDGPNGSYQETAAWLIDQCNQIAGMQTSTISPAANKPIVTAKMSGRDPALPCNVLNSHYDVVPIMREHWFCEPFAADIRYRSHSHRSLLTRHCTDLVIPSLFITGAVRYSLTVCTCATNSGCQYRWLRCVISCCAVRGSGELLLLMVASVQSETLHYCCTIVL